MQNNHKNNNILALPFNVPKHHERGKSPSTQGFSCVGSILLAETLDMDSEKPREHFFHVIVVKKGLWHAVIKTNLRNRAFGFVSAFVEYPNMGFDLVKHIRVETQNATLGIPHFPNFVVVKTFIGSALTLNPTLSLENDRDRQGPGKIFSMAVWLSIVKL